MHSLRGKAPARLRSDSLMTPRIRRSPFHLRILTARGRRSSFPYCIPNTLANSTWLGKNKVRMSFTPVRTMTALPVRVINRRRGPAELHRGQAMLLIQKWGQKRMQHNLAERSKTSQELQNDRHLLVFRVGGMTTPTQNSPRTPASGSGRSNSSAKAKPSPRAVLGFKSSRMY